MSAKPPSLDRLTAQVAERVRRVQRETSDRLASVILKLGLLSEAVLASELAAHLELSQFQSEQLPAAPLTIAYANGAEASNYFGQ